MTTLVLSSSSTTLLETHLIPIRTRGIEAKKNFQAFSVASSGGKQRVSM